MPGVMKTWGDWPAALLVALGPAMPADEKAESEPVTDMEFLEYLGSWDASDDEWLLFDRTDDEPDEEADEDAGDGEEKDDES